MHRHFTATAFVVDSRKRVLLLWHKRLGRWMPPGGHVNENETPEETARRECKEETGLDVEIIGDPSSGPSTGLGVTLLGTGAQEDLFTRNSSEGRMLKKPIALLLEEIPASTERKEPAHQHMDFLYLARPTDASQVLALNHDEGHDLRWFTKSEIENLDEQKEIFANVKQYILRTI